ncbi:MAG: acetyltransferase [Desulfocapsaceae bacterium]|nr:acetyltransferase [Desulfocapsaceae bacterium]
MNKRLLIVGASGHGKVVGDCARLTDAWSELLYFDDRWPELLACGPWQVVGLAETINKNALQEDQTFVAIGNSAKRIAWLNKLQQGGLNLATVIHPSSILSEEVSIGAGTLVVAGAVINIGCLIGEGCIVNTGATIDHDCIVADGVHICPGAHLAGNVHVGSGSWIGIGSTVVQGVRIGVNVTVGAGAVVLDHVADGLTVVGVPAKPIFES